MSGQTCGNCRHFHMTADLAVGECWRYPPTVVPLQNPMGGLGAASIRPPVNRGDGCGEYGPPPLEVKGVG